MCQVTFSKSESYKSKDKLKNFTGSPKWAFIEITSYCSHKCKWCYGGFNNDKSGEISVSDYKLLVAKLKLLGITQITLSGGEPTDHSEFETILELSKDFIINIVTHGEWGKGIADAILSNDVNQVQFNYQGKKHHDGVHGIKGCYEKQLAEIKRLETTDVSTVGSLTVGAYNLSDLPSIFTEMSELGLDRLRVWETTGFGNKFMKDLEAKAIFEEASLQASILGYNYTQSYDPVFDGNIGVDCLALSGLFMYINNKCEHIFCGAVVNQLGNALSNILIDSPETILANQIKFNNDHREGKPYCMARRD